MSRTSLALICTSVAFAYAAPAYAQVTMTPLATFGVNGWIAPGTHPYVSTGNTERGLAYNPMTGNLVLVARQAVAGVSNNIRILSPTTGADLFGLDNTGLTGGGTFLVNMCGVDDLGAIYACNLTTSATGAFVVYKWDNEALGQVTPPTVAFSAVTGLPRVGDAFAVNGGIFFPAQFAAAGSNTVVLPTNSYFTVGSLDATNTRADYVSIPGTSTSNNEFRLAITFVDQDTVIGTQGATARLADFNPLPTPTATVVASPALGAASRRAMDYAVIGGTPMLAVIDTVSAAVTILDLTDPTTPLTLATANNTTGTLTANGNGTGSVAWGPITGNTAVLYAMSSNHGIQAFVVTVNSLASTSVFGTGCDGLAHSTTNDPVLGSQTFAYLVNNVSPISPIAFVAFGVLPFNPGIDLTGIGMPGCFGYHDLAIGLFATGPVIAGTGSFALPLPNNPALAGSVLVSQGVALSLFTPLGLATSNGLLANLGF